MTNGHTVAFSALQGGLCRAEAGERITDHAASSLSERK